MSDHTSQSENSRNSRVERSHVKERRLCRSERADAAISYQLLHLHDLFGLDAIVLADDLGLPIAFAGDPNLAELLSQAAMWRLPDGPAIDEISMCEIKTSYPYLNEWEVSARTLNLPGFEDYCHVLAIGKTIVRSAVVDHAAKGIRRIWKSVD